MQDFVLKKSTILLALIVVLVAIGALAVVSLGGLGACYFVPPMLEQPNPAEVIAENLDLVKVGGKAVNSTEAVTFPTGLRLTSNEIATVAGMSANTVKFCCTGAAEPKCSGIEFPASIECGSLFIYVASETTGKVRVVCPAQDDCYVGFIAG